MRIVDAKLLKKRSVSVFTLIRNNHTEGGVIFLAEDTPQHLPDLVLRIAKAASKPPILSIVTPVPVGTGAALEKKIKDAGLQAIIVSQPVFFTAGCAVEDFNWPDRIILGTNSNDAVLAINGPFGNPPGDGTGGNLQGDGGLLDGLPDVRHVRTPLRFCQAHPCAWSACGSVKWTVYMRLSDVGKAVRQLY